LAKLTIKAAKKIVGS